MKPHEKIAYGAITVIIASFLFGLFVKNKNIGIYILLIILVAAIVFLLCMLVDAIENKPEEFDDDVNDYYFDKNGKIK